MNPSQIHDYGYSERKRYGKMNNASDIFNIKADTNNNSNSLNNRRHQYHHYQLTSPFGRDDIVVDNPHKVHSFYNINEEERKQKQQQQQQPYSDERGSRHHGLDTTEMNYPAASEGMMRQTEPNYGMN